MVNAEARRSQAVELLSDEELAAIKGGYTSFGMKVNFPITAGMKANFQITAGMIEARPLKGFLA